MAYGFKSRSPLGAALLSLILPGLGQLYNGAGRWAAIIIAICLAEFLVINALFSSTAIHSMATFVVATGLVLLALAFYVFVIVDAYRGARRIGELDLRRYNKWYVYVGLVIAANAVVYADKFLPFDARAYSMPSGSMAPTLWPGDYFLTASQAYRSSEPERGDVIVFERPNGGGDTYVKRLVGLPGDRIQISGGVLEINGVPVDRQPLPQEAGLQVSVGTFEMPMTPYLETLPDGHTHRIQEVNDTGRGDDTRVYEVPPNHYFMLGDNRDNSTDSRFSQIGFIPRENLRGQVHYIWWADDLSRLGPLIE